MAVYTPQGLKIRFPVPHVFGLLARVFPDVHPYRVLKTAEGLDCLPSALAFLTALFTFGGKAPLAVIATGGLFGMLLGFLITNRGLFLIPGLPALGTAYSYIHGRGVVLAVLVVLGVSTVGLPGLAVFLGACQLASAVQYWIEFQQARECMKLIGAPLTRSERAFYNAFRLHAEGLGRSTDLDLQHEELADEQWKDTFSAYAGRCPQAAMQSLAVP